jgi:16S rRNA (guanine1207-N2)-methyltransferase
VANLALESLSALLNENPDFVASASSILFLRARAHPSLTPLAQKLQPIQTFKPYAEELRAMGLECLPAPETNPRAELCIYLPTNQKEENLFNFARCMQWLEEGGTLLCSMENGLGASRFEKELKKLAGAIETYSKNKCRVFQARKTPRLDSSLLQQWLAKGQLHQIAGTHLASCPGMFGWNKVDRGSALLCQALPPDLAGRGADVGAGYGYLSSFILRNRPAIRSIALYEAEALALDAARLNLSEIQTPAQITFHWHDVRRGLVDRKLDWIVMNPPFHEGADSAVELGKSFLTSAAAALRPGGELHLVANTRLPYERVLQAHFQQVECCTQQHGFKILRARK